ncbi:hypothetical protein SAMN05421776_11336 [Nocardia farcinica]|uniref:Uncharacterized protein n=1 Tax=Nocardia farcinica TaxID=37329 RepID=A0A0H5P9S9_NOCFR|nr:MULTISPECIES: hypothetical protein [Nocardia]MBF6253921.1 hypothetical protein [Nocardia farcinica]MBF6271117.1 hypothetical protein [Nocardia farcinica]PFW99382.1 hypothetical protein CJ469_05302 [Nocardia farcinica]PFX06793.1 hypothetical protein CJ468_04193 [Nocardia farcinica]CRY84590.1 Uncharacterised protein [Nocardia farcinica]
MTPSDPHKAPQRTWRPENDEYDDAKKLLRARGRGLTEYLRACVRWLRADPDTALAILGEHWPEPRTRGRPRTEESSHEAPR